MLIAVEQVLERRLRLNRDRRSRFGTAFSVCLHLTIVAVAIFSSLWNAKANPPLPYIQAEIVPLQALGQPDPPKPAKKAPQLPPPPLEEDKTESIPEPVEDSPEPVPPEPTDAPLPVRQASPQPASSTPEPVSIPQKAEPPPAKVGSEHGNVRGESAFGAAVASLDNPDFTYGYYLARMVALIRSRWTRPAVAEGTKTTFHFVITKKGGIEDLEIREPSGIPVFDQAALRAIREASPLPPLPVGYRHDTLGVTFIVE